MRFLESIVVDSLFCKLLMFELICWSMFCASFRKIRSFIEEDEIADNDFCTIWFCTIVFWSDSCTESAFDIDKLPFDEELFTSLSEHSPGDTAWIFCFIDDFSSCILNNSIRSDCEEGNFFIIFYWLYEWISRHISDKDNFIDSSHDGFTNE